MCMYCLIWASQQLSYYHQEIFFLNVAQKYLLPYPGSHTSEIKWWQVLSPEAVFLTDTIFFFFFLLFRASPIAYRSSQARSQIRAIDAGLPHSHSSMGSEPYTTAHSSTWSFTRVLMGQVYYHWTTTGTPITDNFYVFIYFAFRAAPVAYGSSQARGLIRAVATGLHDSNTGSEPHLRPIPQLTEMLDP